MRSGGASTAANLGVSNRLFKKQSRSDKVKDSYVHKDMKSKLLVSRKLGLYPLSLLLSTRGSTTTKSRVFDVTRLKLFLIDKGVRKNFHLFMYSR